MTDEIKAINRLLATAPWASATTVLEMPDGRHRLLTDSFVLVPSHWSDWRQHLDECRELADEHGVQGGLLLFGAATYTDMVDVTEDLFEADVF